MAKGGVSLFLAMSLLSPTPAFAQDLSSCNGEEVRRFIGQPVKTMRKVRLDNVRYVCESCPMTMDFSAQRLTVVYSKTTGRVRELGCN